MAAEKVMCVHPDTGRTLQIDRHIYDMFTSAIIEVLKKNPGGLTFNQMVESIGENLKKRKIIFRGSVPWYAVTVKQDMETKRLIACEVIKGKKLHRLSR
ncbi:MAG TPA: hypothetical protein VGC95_08000 [Chitinophagaceae bacterium]|jgi:hypothetical protein